MTWFDTALLSRIQFAFTVTFHILFPAFSIGLAGFLVVMESYYLKTNNPLYLRICKFWSKIFALTFGMGVVSGIVMEFQFGTNWAGFSKQVGGVLGALFTYEVMVAFFVEAGFLGVMLFGWKRVSKRAHFVSTLLVFLGTVLSAYGIMGANTWMQHPQGYQISGGLFSATNWLSILFNYDLLIRFLHMLLAAFLSTGFMISAICAYYLLKKEHTDIAKRCFRFIWTAFIVLVPLQIIMGDMTGEVVLATQPLKTAAMEGIWETQKGAPFIPFAIVDQAQQRNKYAVEIPHGAALINTHQMDGRLVGLKSVPQKDQPPVAWVFYSFRVMVGLGFLMFAMMLMSLWLRYRNRLFDQPWFLRACVWTAPIGFVALETGWIVAEEGRQPWAVYQLVRTMDAASKVPAIDVFISLMLIFVVYGLIFGVFYFRFLSKIIKHGPQLPGHDEKIDRQTFAYLGGQSGDQS